MFPHVVDARYVRDYIIEVTFDDGMCGEVDLKNEIWGPIFQPLKDLSYFKAFKVDRDIQTIVWENGADLAPEFLYERAVKARKH